MLKHSFFFPILLAANGVAILNLFFGGSYIWLCLTLCLTLLILTLGAFDIRLGYFISTYCRGRDLPNKCVALSFDDGPTQQTSEILQLLEQHNARATFFCIGEQVVSHPQICQEIIQRGHTIGNHTLTHSSQFGFLNEKRVEQEICDCDRTIHRVIGKMPRFFRPPFGVTNPSIANAVKGTGHHVIGWSNRSLDTVIKQETKIFNRVIRKLRSGDIILFHDTSKRTVGVIKDLLPYLTAQGYQCVTIDKLLNLKPYED